jgi:4,5:9,10-diseco-3-hydroxy-5,9,17-trioxoandrosta-1(10),2-diene-4-oate hydrolase
VEITKENTSRFAQSGGLRIHYNEAGSGEPLVCLHGGGPGASGWSNYSRNVDAFARRFRTLLVDLPGFGESDKPPIEGEILAFFADAVIGALDTIGVERASFVGNSLGGATSLMIAMRHPARVRRLVLMGPGGGLPILTPWPTEGIKHLLSFYDPPGPSLERLKAFIDVMVYDSSQLTDALLKERFEAATRPDTVAGYPLKRSALGRMAPLWKDLAKVPHRTLVVWGRDDRTVPLDAGLILLNQLPDSRLHVFSKCGHWAQWERAEEFNRLVETFLTDPD